MENKVQTKRQLPNKFIYAGFLMAAIIFCCLRDFSTAIIFSGIGLAFDPFNPTVPFPRRPLWQKAFLAVHLVFVFTLLIIQVVAVLK